MKFKCESCINQEDYTSYSIVIRNYKTIYKHKNQQIVCKICQGEMIPEEIPGEYSVMPTIFKQMSPSEKKKILKQRSNLHFKKEIAEVKREMDLSHIKK